MLVRLCLAGALTLSTSAQESAVGARPVIRKDLLTALLASEKNINRVEIKEVTLAPKVSGPLHLHPCPVVGVIKSGAIAFQIEGQPLQHLRAGDAFFEPALAHIAHFDNEGESPATFTAFYVLGPNDHELIRMLEK